MIKSILFITTWYLLLYYAFQDMPGVKIIVSFFWLISVVVVVEYLRKN